MDEHDLGAGMDLAVPGRRRRGWRGIVLAAPVAGLALGAVLVALQTRGGDEPSTETGVALPSPKTIERDGTTFHVHPAAAVAAAPDPGDPTVVILYAVDVYQPEDPGCSYLQPTARIVSQSAEAVRIATFDYQLPDKTGSKGCGYASAVDPEATMPPGFAALRVRLDAPWDGRPLVDVATGKGIGRVGDLVIPDPGYLPAGFSEHTGPEGMVMPDLSAMANGFMADRTYLGGDTQLQVMAQSASYGMYSGEPVGHDDVGGIRATLTEADYQRCVEWSPQHGLKVEVCSSGNESWLPTAELLRVARGLEFPPPSA